MKRTLSELLDTELKQASDVSWRINNIPTPWEEITHGLHKKFRFRIDTDTNRKFFAFFTVPDKKGKVVQYCFDAYKKLKMEDTWEIHFGLFDFDTFGIGSSELTGLGNASFVFSAVIKIVEIFVEKRHPKTILIKAPLQQSKRVVLYRAMSEKIGKSLGYSIKSDFEETPYYTKKKMKVLVLERD